MQENSRYFNGLGNYRYGLTQGYNVNEVRLSLRPASSSRELALNILYENLIKKLRDKFEIDGDAPASASAVQQYRNHVSTLNSFLAHVGKTVQNRVGVELGTGFDSAVTAYLKSLALAPRTIRDRRAHLRLVQQLYQVVLIGTQSRKEATSFSAELRAAISKSGLAPKTLARRADASTSAVQRWLAGALPNARGIPSLRRLEAQLGLPRDYLVKLSEKEQCAPGGELQVGAISFRERLPALRASAVVLGESELCPEFLAEWWTLYEYKTASMPVLERHPKGTWRCIPAEQALEMGALATRRGMVCATAAMVIEAFRGFLGVVTRLGRDFGGYAEVAQGMQSLAWCAVPHALSAYLDHVTQRAEGQRHGKQRTFCSTVAALVRPETGFLWQQPHLRLRLPEGVRPVDDEAWRAMCARSHRLLRDYRASATDISRDPKEPIAHLLELEQPLKPILDAIAKLDAAAAKAPPGGDTEARMRRDALLLAMLLSNPLRIRTFITMTWSTDGKGMLRGNAVAGWRIHLRPQHIKNGRGHAGKDYSVRVAAWVKPRLEAYLEEYRPTLLRGESSAYLFVASKGKGGAKWESMRRWVQVLTKRYVPGGVAFGAHAFRHLVATDWLEQHPNDFLTVAELLNDTLATVLARYAHMRRDVSFSRYEAHIDTLLQRRSR